MDYIERDGFYIRKRDGFRVVACDWPDGTVTWLLDPMPLCALRIAGTCSRHNFERTHSPLPVEPNADDIRE